MKIHLYIFLIILLLFFSCHHRGRHSHHFSLGLSFTPIVVSRSGSTVLVHDSHIHDEFCGHPRRWFNNRWVYFYNGRWEYYDSEEGVYYYIDPELIEDSDD